MVLRVLRVLRILRILRLLKGAKEVRNLIMTLALSFPALINVVAVLTVIGLDLAVPAAELTGEDERYADRRRVGCHHWLGLATSHAGRTTRRGVRRTCAPGRYVA